MAEQKIESKSSKGRQTRELLLEAALLQFAANGYHGTSMRQIADAAGLAVGGIYNHFAGKEEILKAIILEYHPLNVIAPRLSAAQGESVESLLRDAAHRFYDAIKARPAMLNLLFIELVECNGQHLPELFEILFTRIEPFAQRLLVLNEGLSPRPPLVMMRIFFSTLMGFFITETIFSKIPALPPAMGKLDDFVDVLLYGLLRTSASPRT
jgi:AcrR family transcriptional regulator